MSVKTITVPGYLRDIESKEIVTEVSVQISFISPPDLKKQPGIKGTLTIQSFKPEYDDKEFILDINEKISGRVKITMQPMTNGDMDLISTKYDIGFVDSFWTSSTEWFESL